MRTLENYKDSIKYFIGRDGDLGSYIHKDEVFKLFPELKLILMISKSEIATAEFKRDYIINQFFENNGSREEQL